MAYENRDYTHLSEEEKQKIELIAQAIRNKAYGIDVRESIALAIEWVNREYKTTIINNELTLKEFENAKSKVANLELDMDEFIKRYSEQVAGNTTLDETIDARVDATGVSHTVLKDRLDKENTQLVDISDREFKSNLRAKSHAITFRKPVITWIDDDGRKGVYTKIYPLMKKYDVKMSSAIIGHKPHGLPGGDPNTHPNYINYDEIQEMQKTGHVEFVSHSYTHGGPLPSDLFINLNEYELIDDFEKQDKLFKKANLTRGHFVIPYGSHTKDTLEIIPQYSKSAFITKPAITSTPIDRTNFYSLPHSPFYLNRISLDTGTETYLREKLAEGAETNSWITWISHVDEAKVDMDMMDRLVSYALSLGYEFKTVSETWNERGHILDLDDSRRKGGKREYNTVITADGEVSGKVLGNYRWAETGEYLNNAPITDFPIGTFMRRKIRTADSNDFNIYAQTRYQPSGGFIETHRDYLDDAFSYERYVETVAPEKRIELYRGWDKNAEQWKPWVSLKEPVVGGFSSAPNPLTPNSPISDFPMGVTSKIMVSVANATTWGVPTHGLVEVYRGLEAYASYQKLIGIGNKSILYRRWESERWGDWETW